jgi:hypothetical protein
VWGLPFFVAVWFLIAPAAAWYFRRRVPDAELHRRYALSGPLLAYIAVSSLACALVFATRTALELERVSYRGAPDGTAGLISANAEEVVLAVCLKDRPHRLAGVRLWRVPRTHIRIVKVGGKPFFVDARSVVTLANVVLGLSVDRESQGRCG